MSLYYQPVLVELTKISLFLFDENAETKRERKNSPPGMKVLFLFPCWQKRER